jgi:hypothetical protein
MSRRRAAPKPKRGRPVGDHHSKRTELVDAAWNLIIREGYELRPYAGSRAKRNARQAPFPTILLTRMK